MLFKERSFFDICSRSLRFCCPSTFSNYLSFEATGPFQVIFHIEISLDPTKRQLILVIHPRLQPGPYVVKVLYKLSSPEPKVNDFETL